MVYSYTHSEKKKSLSILAKVWKEIGMKVSIMSMDEYDKIMSITSHLPHLIAFTIVGTAFGVDLKKKEILLTFQQVGSKTLQELVHQIQKCGLIFSLQIKNI